MKRINSTNYIHTFVVVFFIPMHILRGIFFTKGTIMQMTLIKNTSTPNTALAYKIARVVYAQTGAKSLHLVEAITSMIKNLSVASGIDIANIICDTSIFDVLEKSSPNHYRISEPATSRAFQMCVRTAQRMLMGALPDTCFGATRFHSSDVIPEWATSRGYIADIDGLLFYL